MTIRVLLVDDHAVVRAGLRWLLEAEPDIAVIGEADRGSQALDLARALLPDVVITDLLLPDVDGIEVTQSIRAAFLQTQVVILTGVGEEDAAVVRAVRAGAIGYVPKSANNALLVQTIRSAAAGQVHLSPLAAARLMREVRSPKREVPLTDRERMVLREIAIGRTNKQIARSLHIAESTVKSHVRTILDKLDVESRTQAALQALRSQIFSTDELKVA
jgi:two-component system, NarL family, response regulator LiaR